MGNIELDWNTINQQVDKIGKYITENNIKLIVGICRGGLVPAVMLSNRTGIPMTCLEWQTRDGTVKDKRKEFKESNKDIMFIDYLADSGRTICEIREAYPGARFSVLINKTVDLELDFGATLLYHNKQWIKFPWE